MPLMKERFSSISLFFCLVWVATFTNPHINAVINIAIVLAVISYILSIKINEIYLLRKNYIAVLVIIMMVGLMLSSMRDENILSGLNFFKKDFLKPAAMALILGHHLCRDRKHFKYLLYAVLANAAMMTVVVYWQYYQDYTSGIFTWHSNDLYRWHGYHAIFNESFLAASLFLSKSRTLKSLIIILLAAQIPVVILTSARAAWGAILVAFVMTYILAGGLKMKNIGVSVVRILTVIIPIMLFTPGGSLVQSKVAQGLESKGRTEVAWPNTIKMIELSPLTGHGYHFRSYNRSIEEHKDEVQLKGDIDALMPGLGRHNIFLTFTFQNGLIGLALLTTLLLSLIWILMNYIIAHPKPDPIKIISAASLGVMTSIYFVRGMVEDPKWVYLVIPIAIGVYLSWQKRQSPEETQ